MNSLYKRLKNKIYQKTWFLFIVCLHNKFKADECSEKAGSLTYTTTLSLVPMLTVFIVILSSIPSLDSAKDKILNWVYGNVLPQTSIKISQYFNDFAEKSTNLTFIGVSFLFITTLMLLAKIENVFNAIWQVPLKEKGMTNFTFADFSRYWLMVTLMPILLGTAFLLSSTVSSLHFLNREFAGYVINWGIWLEFFSGFITVMGIVCIYWLMPTCKVPFRSALLAGTLTGVAFETLKSLFSILISNFSSYQVIYGAFAALPLLLLWIYLLWCILLIGVELSFMLTNFSVQQNTEKNNHDFMFAIQILFVLHHAQKKGNSLYTQDLLQAVTNHNLNTKEGFNQWQIVTKKLVTANFITKDQDNQWLLKTHVEQIHIKDLAKLFDLLNLDKITNTVDGEHLDFDWKKLIKLINSVNNIAEYSLDKPLTAFFLSKV